MNDCLSFAPQICKKSEILILGSMPGVKSLELQQYYAHPQNRFWKIMGRLCGKDLYNSDYKTRIKTLLNNKFALWDVIQYCERSGSLDSNIENEIPNDIPNLLQKNPQIKMILLNGNKSYSAFKKYFPYLPEQYKCYKMPSTSPANARFSLEDLCKIWRETVFEAANKNVQH